MNMLNLVNSSSFFNFENLECDSNPRRVTQRRILNTAKITHRSNERKCLLCSTIRKSPRDNPVGDNPFYYGDNPFIAFPVINDSSVKLIIRYTEYYLAPFTSIYLRHWGLKLFCIKYNITSVLYTLPDNNCRDIIVRGITVV